ncbi:MAG: thiamine pyrophosphate-dependent enzyme [Bacteroidota bacterium]|nr:thiamine pyrophosphate-dependent enzyme [Bacteroidota bacterium]
MNIQNGISFRDFRSIVLNDYRIANESRNASIAGRREVLTGKAKFGIFGDGKEIAQLAMAKVFREGDFRSGYYRDQTFMMATGMSTLNEFFAQLYGDTDLSVNPGNGGRIMNNHFATRNLDEYGKWKDLTKQKNSSADISPTAGQMPRLLGLALASKLYRNNRTLDFLKGFSIKGNEVAFGTIGDASTSEGHFFETLNAAGVLQVPLALSVWDDGYGISVPKKYQTTKEDIGELLKGFERDEKIKGIVVFRCKGWDYAELCDMYEKGIKICRDEQVPVVFHVTEMTQPLGHSTSGSHERYKSKERLEWEAEVDCIKKMKEWIIENSIASAEELEKIENEALNTVKKTLIEAREHFYKPLRQKRDELIGIINDSDCHCPDYQRIIDIRDELLKVADPIRKDSVAASRRILRFICVGCDEKKSMKKGMLEFVKKEREEGAERYSSHLYSCSDQSILKVSEIKPKYDIDSPIVNGREILLANWDYLLGKYPELLIFGEDVGHLGGVNQTYEGLQLKYGEDRVTDTGIRESTIIGQGIGLAMRGLRPVAEIQYFDYLLYGLQTISDDIATLQYRTKGGQKAPLIITTRGHRLEGIWHSGSPLSMIINAIRGVPVMVPRNMTVAAGFYNTLIVSDDPGLVIEPLNGYRIKEKLPANIGEYRVPVGIPEILVEGTDITLVTYGSCVRIAMDAVIQLQDAGIFVELIDVQTLIPFDINHMILNSLKKTNKILFFDEDFPGGATAYMMKRVLEDQKAFEYLETTPRTLTAKPHRPAYTTDGDYFSNPNSEDVYDAVYSIMNEVNPVRFRSIY